MREQIANKLQIQNWRYDKNYYHGQERKGKIFGFEHKRPYQVTAVHNIGTVTIRCRNFHERINIRRLKREQIKAVYYQGTLDINLGGEYEHIKDLGHNFMNCCTPGIETKLITISLDLNLLLTLLDSASVRHIHTSVQEVHVLYSK